MPLSSLQGPLVPTQPSPSCLLLIGPSLFASVHPAVSQSHLWKQVLTDWSSGDFDEEPQSRSQERTHEATELVFIIIVSGFSSMFSYCYHSTKILMKAIEDDEEKQEKARKPSCTSCSRMHRPRQSRWSNTWAQASVYQQNR